MRCQRNRSFSGGCDSFMSRFEQATGSPSPTHHQGIHRTQTAPHQGTGMEKKYTNPHALSRTDPKHSPMADIHLILEAQLEQMPLPPSLGTQHYPTLLPETLPTSYAPWRYAATAGTLGSKNKCHFKSSFCKAALETPEDHCRIPAHSASTPHPTSTHHRHHSKASNPAERSSAEGRRKNAGKAQSSRWMD